MFYTPDQSADIIEAINSIELGNNGYADIGTDVTVAAAVELAGYAVIKSRDLHGKSVFRGYTQAGYEALKQEAFAVPRARTPLKPAARDYEPLLLARTERATELY